MKPLLDWQNPEVVDIYDEVNLWSAPFGLLLLEQLPMQPGLTIVDVGFGTGFPLIELAQRFGPTTRVYGIDIWDAAISRSRKKADRLGLTNVEIMARSATDTGLPDGLADLVTSNLGINNFAEKDRVLTEILRILKPRGKCCITTNPVGTFREFYTFFAHALEALELREELAALQNHQERRGTPESIVTDFSRAGFDCVKKKAGVTHLRFSAAAALFDHSLIRIGFREQWEAIIGPQRRDEVFGRLSAAIEKEIATSGVFTLTVPMLYLEFEPRRRED